MCSVTEWRILSSACDCTIRASDIPHRMRMRAAWQQWKRASPVTQMQMERNHLLLSHRFLVSEGESVKNSIDLLRASKTLVTIHKSIKSLA